MINSHPTSHEEFNEIMLDAAKNLGINPYGNTKENGENVRIVLIDLLDDTAKKNFLPSNDIILGELIRNLTIAQSTNK